MPLNNKNKYVFTFFFSVEDGNDGKEIMYAFELPKGDKDFENLLWDYTADNIQNEERDLEVDFGVHDVSGKRREDIISIGYDTYEVEENQILPLMTLWRDFFVSKFGENEVGSIVEIGSSMSLKEIYDACAKNNYTMPHRNILKENPVLTQSIKEAYNRFRKMTPEEREAVTKEAMKLFVDAEVDAEAKKKTKPPKNKGQ